MTLLIIGLVLFLGIHLVPAVPPLRAGLVGAMGENGYKGLFALLSLAGLVVIVMGYARAPYVHVYNPMPGAKHLAMTVMPIVFILLAAANMPGKIRATLKHPMLIAVLLWAGAHLLANGDLRSILLFGSFAAYAVVDLISELARGKTLIGDKTPTARKDLMAVVGGLLVFAVFMYFHGALFGVALVGS
ncbi:MAG: NnrU family protein [Xanthomonadales bacterium]|nr:NnrU family protein [Xanthomonadales bacterium]